MTKSAIAPVSNDSTHDVGSEEASSSCVERTAAPESVDAEAPALLLDRVKTMIYGLNMSSSFAILT